MPSSVWLQWYVCVPMLLVPSLACLPCCHTPKNVSNRCHNYSNVTAAWPYQKENIYYIEIYMNIDIDGSDFTIFVYSFYSLFTQAICVCTVFEHFAYWHLWTDLQWTVMTLLNLGICKCSIVWCPEALGFIIFFLFLFMKKKMFVFGFDIPIKLALYIVAKLCMMILSLLFHFFDKEKKKNRKNHPDVKYNICSVCLYLVSVHAVILSYCLVVISRWRCAVQLNGAHLL